MKININLEMDSNEINSFLQTGMAVRTAENSSIIIDMFNKLSSQVSNLNYKMNQSWEASKAVSNNKK